MTARELKEKLIKEEYWDKIAVILPRRRIEVEGDSRIMDIHEFGDAEEISDEQLEKIFLKIIG